MNVVGFTIDLMDILLQYELKPVALYTSGWYFQFVP